MKISFSLYELETISSGLKRPGALLQITFPSGKTGFADCFVWPELGDLPLKQQLDQLAAGVLTPITSCAIELAKIDADARSDKKMILSKTPLPRSHLLITDLLNCTCEEVQKVMQQGFTHVKLKVGRSLDQEAKKIHELFSNASLKLRLDFNEMLTADQFAIYLQSIETLKKQIDFIEDPFPFHPGEWKRFQDEGWTLACDRQADLAYDLSESARVLIVKPALVPFKEWQRGQNQTRIATSYLGHPLGQVAAALAAVKLDPSCHFVHGLHSHLAYQPTPLSRQLNGESPEFISPSGTGFGFDEDLANLTWEILR